MKVQRATLSVTVADVSPKMLEKCDFADRRILLPEEEITDTFDLIILRQVIQYIPKGQHSETILALIQKLKPNGVIFVSQITPHTEVDFEYWQTLLRKRRPTRQSFPSTSDLFELMLETDLRLLEYRHSHSRQSTKNWLHQAEEQVATDVVGHLLAAPTKIKNLWRIRITQDTIEWSDHWIHLLFQNSQPII